MGVEVTRDEADKKRDEIKARHRTGEIDPTTVKGGDRRFRYRGVNNRPDRIARYETFGYEIVPPDDKAQWEYGNIKKDGMQLRANEQILMRAPMEIYEERRKKNRDKLTRQINAGKEMTRERVNKIARDGGLARPHKDAAFVEDE